MAFGQASGPPANPRKVQELLGLLRDAGHADFRDARGPMGFSQRQAAGKFTRDEVDAFIEQLEGADGTEAGGEVDGAEAAPRSALADVASEHLASELGRRGWLVVEPLGQP